MVDLGKEFDLSSYFFLTTNAGFLGTVLSLQKRQIDDVFCDSGPDLLIPEAKGIIVNSFSKLEQYAIDDILKDEKMKIPPIYTVGPVIKLKDVRDDLKRFYPAKRTWGFDELLPMQTFEDINNGYLVNDCCLFGAELFVVERTGRCERVKSLTPAENSYKFTWKLHNFFTITNPFVDDNSMQISLFLSLASLPFVGRYIFVTLFNVNLHDFYAKGGRTYNKSKVAKEGKSGPQTPISNDG
ncbi:hypothetical protein K1719_026072 [Acacia pycnantha]|nr:hypothetical protein K1719_026072 [Acacia pycnantha]